MTAAPPPGTHRHGRPARPPPRPDLEERSPPATWRPVEAIPVFGVAVVITVVLGAIVGQLVTSCGAQFVALALAGEAAFAGGVVLWVAFVNRGPLAALGRSRRPWRDLGLGLGSGLLLVGVGILSSTLVLSVAELILGREPDVPDQIQACVRGGSFVAAGAVAVVAAPVGEELFFRGFLYKGLRRRLSVWPAALASAVPFALIHVSPVLILALFPIGVGLALVYEHRQSIVASVAAHAAFNLIGFLAIAAGR